MRRLVHHRHHLPQEQGGAAIKPLRDDEASHAAISYIMCTWTSYGGLDASTMLHRLVDVDNFPHGSIPTHEIGDIKVLVVSL